MFSVGLAAVLALCVAGAASATTTIDLVFGGSPPTVSGGPNTVTLGAPGTVTMGVFMTTDDPLEIFSVTIAWDNSGTSAAGGTLEWNGINIFGTFFIFTPGIPGLGGTFIDNAAQRVYAFDGFQSIGSMVPAGTYQLGTIVWSAGSVGTTNISSVITSGLDGFLEPGNVLPTTLNLNTAIINVVPEPGTASLLGLGLVGLILAGRRKRA